jgi:hypothetical protein
MHITGYFAIKPEHYNSNSRRFGLIPNNDFLIIDEIPNSVKVYRDLEKIILHTVIHQNQIEVLESLAEVETEIELITALEIQGVWLGETLEDVYAKYPELNKTTNYTDLETGETYEMPLIRKHNWGK